MDYVGVRWGETVHFLCLPERTKQGDDYCYEVVIKIYDIEMQVLILQVEQVDF